MDKYVPFGSFNLKLPMSLVCVCRLVCAVKAHSQRVVGIDFQPGMESIKVSILTLLPFPWTCLALCSLAYGNDAWKLQL